MRTIIKTKFFSLTCCPLSTTAENADGLIPATGPVVMNFAPWTPAETWAAEPFVRVVTFDDADVVEGLTIAATGVVLLEAATGRF